MKLYFLVPSHARAVEYPGLDVRNLCAAVFVSVHPSLCQQCRSEKRICSSNKLQSKYCWLCQVFDVDEKYLQAYYFIWRRQ